MTKELVDNLHIDINLIQNSTRISIANITELNCCYGLKTGNLEAEDFGLHSPIDSDRFSTMVHHQGVGSHGTSKFFYTSQGLFELLSGSEFNMTPTTTVTIRPTRV